MTLWDVGCERQVGITGSDAFEFTNMLTPRDLMKCSVGQCKYAPLTAGDGGIFNDPILLRIAEEDRTREQRRDGRPARGEYHQSPALGGSSARSPSARLSGRAREGDSKNAERQAAARRK